MWSGGRMAKYEPVPTRMDDEAVSSPPTEFAIKATASRRRLCILCAALALLISVIAVVAAFSGDLKDEIESATSRLRGETKAEPSEDDYIGEDKAFDSKDDEPNSKVETPDETVESPENPITNDDDIKSPTTDTSASEGENASVEATNEDEDWGDLPQAGADRLEYNETLNGDSTEGDSEVSDDNSSDEAAEDEAEQVTSTVPNAEGRYVIPCVPRICANKKHFITNPNLLADKHGFTLLASFPGAGSTWTRAVIEEATRVYSGSVYPTDIALLHDGFQGEKVSSFDSLNPRVSVIKTHHPLFSVGPNKKTKYVIQVLRSPFDALVSEFNREFSTGGHVGIASPAVFANQFPAWFKKRARGFWGHMKFWNGPRFFDCKDCAHRGNGVTTFELLRPIFGDKYHFDEEALMKNPDNQKAPVLVVFYEDLYYAFAETVTRILAFLKEKSLGKASPPVDAGLACALVYMSRVTGQHRSSKSKEYNPFRDQSGDLAKSGAVSEFCALMKDFWVEEKWGKCEDGYLQPERQGVRKRVPLPKVLRKTFCAAPPH